MMKVLYHKNCLDGLGAAYAVWHRYGNVPEYIPVAYGEEPPDVTDHDVIIVDFSYKREILIDMHTKAKSLLVLDHHKTAQEDLEGLRFAQFDMEMSGAAMAWDYFHPGKKRPYVIDIIQDRDLWTFKYPETRDLTAALYARFKEGISLIRRAANADQEGLKVLIEQGAVLNKVFDDEVEQFIKYPTLIELCGIKGLVVNAPGRFASETGHPLAEQGGTFGGIFFWSGKQNVWAFSIRSVKGGNVDVSAIAKHFGGGGHFNAAGFSLTPEQFNAVMR